MKTRQLRTRMTLSTNGPCLQLLLKTNLKVFDTKKITPDSAITGDCGDVTSSHSASPSTAEGGLASPRHCRLPGQHHFPSLPGHTTASCSSLNPRKQRMTPHPHYPVKHLCCATAERCLWPCSSCGEELGKACDWRRVSKTSCKRHTSDCC